MNTFIPGVGGGACVGDKFSLWSSSSVANVNLLLWSLLK